jgi:saccharopine dehydrogenase-like NADP-dependent oxidoreductase
VRVALLGAGAVGARVARQLASTSTVERLVVADLRPGVADALARGIADPDRVVAVPVERWADNAELGVLATPAGGHRAEAERLLEQGSHVVSVGDDLEEVRALLELDAEARRRERAVVVGAGFAPGLTCVLASHAAAAFDVVDEVHVAKVGTAGPACAETHHRALAGEAVDWRAGEWVSRAGGSGRELCWFPDPVGGQDCYRAALPDAVLLHGAFPGAARITARMGATRRDRLTARLPMLRKPHPEGTIGAVRVEVRGRRGGACEVEVLGAIDRPGVAAGCVAAVAGIWALEERLERWGAGGLAELVSPVPFLAELARRGVKAAVFDGALA